MANKNRVEAISRRNLVTMFRFEPEYRYRFTPNPVLLLKDFNFVRAVRLELETMLESGYQNRAALRTGFLASLDESMKQPGGKYQKMANALKRDYLEYPDALIDRLN